MTVFVIRGEKCTLEEASQAPSSTVGFYKWLYLFKLQRFWYSGTVLARIGHHLAHLWACFGTTTLSKEIS